MIDQSAAANGLNPDKENELAISLIAYISITKSYQLTDSAKKQNHFAVIRYGATDTLRPFAMSGPARHLLAAEQVKAAMQKVISMDSENHPEWIAKSLAIATQQKDFIPTTTVGALTYIAPDNLYLNAHCNLIYKSEY